MSLDLWTYDAGPDDWPDNGIGSLGYRELKDSGNATFGATNTQAERHFIVDYEEGELFMLDLLGWGFWGGSVLHRTLPDEHPFFKKMFATSATMELWGEPDQQADFIKKDFWKVSATYEPVDYPVLADADVTAESQRFCSFKYGFQTQFLTKSSYFQFEQPPNNKVAAQPATRTSCMQIQLTWHQVPSVDSNPYRCPLEAKILFCQGKLNGATFLGFAPGTVQFAGADPMFSKPRVATTATDPGLYTWDITYTFLIKDEGVTVLYPGDKIGWQFSYDVKENRWDHLRSCVGNQLPFESTDLNTLFTIS